MEKPNFETGGSIENNITKEGESEEKQKRKIFRMGVSPTGANKKSIGALRTHLYNYAFSRSQKTEEMDSLMIYRVDDTNIKNQSKEKTFDDYVFFTKVLGFEFDISPYNSHNKIGQSVFQSERNGIYKKKLEILFDKGFAFVDPISGLTLFDIERFVGEHTNILEIDEILRGRIKIDLEEKLKQGQKYFPLMRSDGSVLYHLASVVDDDAFDVTHVVRGIDKLPIIDYQEMVRVALGLQPVKYLHTPMLISSQSQQYLKFNELIKNGILPQALVSYMISSGYGNSEEIYPSMDKFINDFNYLKVHKNNGNFDFDILSSINNKLIKKISNSIFLDSFSIFLIKNGKINLSDKLSDSDISKFIVSMRRNQPESKKIMEGIFSPEYELIKGEFVEVVKYLLEVLTSNHLTFPSSEGSGFSKEVFLVGLRWVLVGKFSFPEIEFIFSYLSSKNLLYLRVQDARFEFLRQTKETLEK